MKVVCRAPIVNPSNVARPPQAPPLSTLPVFCLSRYRTEPARSAILLWVKQFGRPRPKKLPIRACILPRSPCGILVSVIGPFVIRPRRAPHPPRRLFVHFSFVVVFTVHYVQTILLGSIFFCFKYSRTTHPLVGVAPRDVILLQYLVAARHPSFANGHEAKEL